MGQTVKFEDLTKEQQTALKSAGRKFVFKMFLNGVNYGGLLFMSNLILSLLNLSFFNSQGFLWTGAIVLAIVFLRMMGTANREAAQEFKERATEILEQK